jgi:hypothetical protein
MGETLKRERERKEGMRRRRHKGNGTNKGNNTGQTY